MYKKIYTGDMTREEWLEARNSGIGGSDAGTVLGLNPYKSRYALWAEKTGKVIPEDISDREAVRLGNDLEEYVASRFTEYTKIKHRRYRYILRNPDYPFAIANVDRMLHDSGGLEIKTTSSYEYGKLLADGIIPDVWLCQMTHYMMVTGAPHWYLGALVFGKGFYCIKLERDEEEIAALAAAEAAFWELVQTDTPPGVDGMDSTTEAISTIFADSNGTEADLSAVSVNVELMNSYTAEAKKYDQLAEEQRNIIKTFMGESERGSFGTTTISWKTQQRRSFDKERYEKENGKIPDEYYRESTSRVFRVTNRKGT